MLGWPRRRTRILIYLMILVVTFVYFGISIYNDYYPPTIPIERFFEITVPEAATDVQARYDWVFQGGAFYLQFRLPAQDFEAFKTAVCRDGELGEDYNDWATRFRDTQEPDWFLTDPASISVSARCLQPIGADIDLMVDRSDADVFAIYLRGSRS